MLPFKKIKLKKIQILPFEGHSNMSELSISSGAPTPPKSELKTYTNQGIGFPLSSKVFWLDQNFISTFAPLLKLIRIVRPIHAWGFQSVAIFNRAMQRIYNE